MSVKSKSKNDGPSSGRKKQKLNTGSEEFTPRRRRSVSENLSIPVFEGEIELRYPPDEDEPDAGLFRGGRSTEFRNTPCPELTTPASRRIRCTPREYLAGLTKDSPYRKKEESSDEDEPSNKLVSPPLITRYSQYSIYLASIQGAKDSENLRANLRQKKLFSSENDKLEGSENCSSKTDSSNCSSSQTPSNEILEGVAVYVEVFSESVDVSLDFVKLLKSLGATIRLRLTKTVTHVVFKDGSVETYQKAKQLKIPMVSILWIEACMTQKKLVPVDSFVPLELDKYKFPELLKKEVYRKNFERRTTRKSFRKAYAEQYTPQKNTPVKNNSTTSVQEMNETPGPSGRKN